jgi:hypothetical protein
MHTSQGCNSSELPPSSSGCCSHWPQTEPAPACLDMLCNAGPTICGTMQRSMVLSRMCTCQRTTTQGALTASLVCCSGFPSAAENHGRHAVTARAPIWNRCRHLASGRHALGRSISARTHRSSWATALHGAALHRQLCMSAGSPGVWVSWSFTRSVTQRRLSGAWTA